MSMIRQTLFRQARTFTSTPISRKTLTETVKETAEAVNKKIGQAAASGIQSARMSPRQQYWWWAKLIDSIEDTTNSAKASAGMEANKAEGDAQQMAGQAKGDAQQMAGQAKGKAAEMEGQAKGYGIWQYTVSRRD
jgi:hypothetical protein